MDTSHSTQNLQKRHASESPNRPHILHAPKHNLPSLEEGHLMKIEKHMIDEAEHLINHMKQSRIPEIKVKDVARILRTAASALVRIADVPDVSVRSIWLRAIASEDYENEIECLLTLPEDVYKTCVAQCYQGAIEGSWANLLFNGMSHHSRFVRK